MKTLTQYKPIKAIRPFSLVVGFVSCALGVYLAWLDGHMHISLALLIISGGVAAQAGINLINDLEDISLIDASKTPGKSAIRQIKQNALSGYGCFLFAIVIAAYLVSLQGWPLFWLIACSAVTALSYNLGPINFKHRGLSMIQVFLLMGVLMVQGAYYSMSGNFSSSVLLHSIPISLLVSLLLLSNELRDWEYDSQHEVRTLTVRIGYKDAVLLYWTLLASSFIIAVALLQSNLLGSSGNPLKAIYMLLPLIVLKPIIKSIKANTRPELTPLTGRFFLLFGLSYMLALS